MENLLLKMENIVEQKVKNYKTDLEYDLKQIRKNYNEKYLWIPYICGTCLIPIHKLLYKGDFSNTLINQYLNYQNNTVSAYILEIKDVKRKNFYGEITEINPKKALTIINKYNNLEYTDMIFQTKINNKKDLFRISKTEEEKYRGRILDIILDKLKVQKEEIDIDFLRYEPSYNLEEEQLLKDLKNTK